MEIVLHDDVVEFARLVGPHLQTDPLRHTMHSTSLISGSLFVAIGVLFLLTDGTAEIIAPTTLDQQSALQTAIQRCLGSVPDAAVLLVLVLIALAVVGARLRRRRDPEPRTAQDDREREEAR